MVVVDLPSGNRLEDLVQRDSALETGQCRPETEVDPVAEREVPADVRVERRSDPRRRTGSRRGWLPR